jgi:hypothetical protein
MVWDRIKQDNIAGSWVELHPPSSAEHKFDHSYMMIIQLIYMV